MTMKQEKFTESPIKLKNNHLKMRIDKKNKIKVLAVKQDIKPS